MKGNVLIVDDDSSTRELLSRYLGQCGYACDVAGGCAEAEEKLAAGEYHVVVTDKNMPSENDPDESGLTLIRHLHLHYPAVGAIVITGFATIESVIEAMRLGAFDYIAKPFDLAVLQAKIDRIRDYQATQAPESFMRAYRLLLKETFELYERCEHQADGKDERFLAFIQSKIDVFFEQFRVLERILLFQRDRLAEVASLAGHALDTIQESDPAFPVLMKIADESGHRL